MTTTPTASPELLDLAACPFCGGTEAFVERADYSAALVVCDSRVDEHSVCMARGPIGIQDDDGEEIPGQAAAIREWNKAAALARRAQPEGEAPQADWIGALVLDVAELPDRDSPEEWPEAMLVTGNELRTLIALHAPAASLSPLCGAQHAESGKEATVFANDGTEPDWSSYATVEAAEQAAASGTLEKSARALAAKWHKDAADTGFATSEAAVELLEVLDAATSAPGTPEAPADIVLDAQRWRALLGSARIRPLGSAGIVNPQSGNYAHMGLEIWTTGDWSDCPPDLQKRLKYDHEVGVEWLTKYADIARAAQLNGGQGETR